MLTKQAKVLTEAQIAEVLEEVTHKELATRNRAMVLLSVKAGLRAKEIADLTWSSVLQADGTIGRHLDVTNAVAKGKRGGRRIPINDALHQALTALYAGEDKNAPMIRSARGWHMTAQGVTNWFWNMYHDLGFIGASSHSGRRTFITQLARRIGTVGGSLRDVQELAGHASIAMTQKYIAQNEEAQRAAVALL